MAIGPKPAFSPTFVQSLLDLPQEQLDKLVSHLDKHVKNTEKLLKVEDNVKAFKDDYKKLADQRSAAYDAYSQALAEDYPAARTSTSLARTEASPEVAKTPPSPARTEASSAARTPPLQRVNPTKLDYDRKTDALHKLAKRVESIKDKMKELLASVKISSKESLDAVTDLYNEFSSSSLAHQDSLDRVVDHANALVLGTPADPVAGTASKPGVLDTIRDTNNLRKAALKALGNARVLYTPGLSHLDKKVEDIMKKAKVTGDLSKELRTFCQNLSDTDLDKIFGKADSAERKVFASIIETGKTRDNAGIPSLTKVLGTHPTAVKNMVGELLKRTNETRKRDEPCTVSTAIRHNTPNFIANLNDYIPGFVATGAEGFYNFLTGVGTSLGSYVPGPVTTAGRISYESVAALHSILPYDPLMAPVKIPSLTLNAANQATLDALSPAVNKPEVLGDALIKLGDEPLKELILAHLNDENAIYHLTDEIPLDELVLGLAYTLNNSSPKATISREVIENLIENSDNQAKAISLLKSARNVLRVDKIELNLPWTCYRPRVIVDTLGINLFSAKCVTTAAVGYVGIPIAGSIINPVVNYVAAPLVRGSLAIASPVVGLTATALSYASWPLGKITDYALQVLVDNETSGWVKVLRCTAVISPLAVLAAKTDYPSRAYNYLSQMVKNRRGIESSLKHKEIKRVSPSVPVKPAVTTTRVFERATLPTVFEVIKPEDTDSYAHKVHAGIETILSPLSNFFKICNEKAEGFFGSEEESSKMIAHLCDKWDIDPTNIANCSTMVAHLEALFNWGGRIPYICALTGMGRIAIGLIEAAAASAIGLWTIAFSKNEEASLVGQSILKQYALKQGFGNVARGIFESTSWAISIMTNLPRDLLGIRWSYEGERASDINITPMFKDLINEVQKKVKEATA